MAAKPRWQLSVMLSQREHDTLSRMAKANGLSKSACFRLWLNQHSKDKDYTGLFSEAFTSSPPKEIPS